MIQMESGDLLVKDLRQNIDIILKLSRLGELDVLLRESRVLVLVQHDLSKHLVGETTGHDERTMAGGAAKVDKATFRKQDDVAAVLHLEAVDLRLDLLVGLGVGLEPGNVNLDIEVTNV
jgi:hypothetical protein